MSDYENDYKQAQKKLEELDTELVKSSSAWNALKNPGNKIFKHTEELIINETNILLYYLDGFKKAKEKEKTIKTDILTSKDKLTETYLDSDVSYKSNAKKKKYNRYTY